MFSDLEILARIQNAKRAERGEMDESGVASGRNESRSC